MARSFRPAETGQVLDGRYRLGPQLGGGGMAQVFVGHDARLSREVAIKVVRHEVAADPAMRRRFAIEGRAVARLSHPNVVGVYDVGDDGGNLYLVMELVRGGTLADRIHTGPLPQEVVRRVGLDILAGLGAAHEAGLLHRDVKPGNVLIDESGTAKLADFGVAKSESPSDGDLTVTATGTVLGTPSYLAPERAAGAPARVESDLWAVGVVLYEALTGIKPFQGPTPLATALAARTGDCVPLAVRRPDVDPALAAAVQRAISPDPAARYPNATAMAQAIGGQPEWGPPAGAAPAPDATAVLPASSTAILERDAIGPDGKRAARGTQIRLALASAAALVAVLVVLILAIDRHPAPARPLSPTTIQARTTTPPTPTTPPPTSAAPTTSTPPITSAPPPAGVPAKTGPRPPATPAAPGHPDHGKGHDHGH